MPELGHDALAIHLFIPSHVASRHSWDFNVQLYIWAVMPTLGDWIYCIAYSLGGETAARLLNVGFLLVLCRLIRELILWAGGTAAGVRWAILFALTTPLTFIASSSLFIELIWSAFVVAGTLEACRIATEPNGRHLLLAGLLLGFAASAKA